MWDPAAWWDGAIPASPAHVRWLFEQGLSPYRRNWLGITLLHRCAAKGDQVMAAVCLEHGCPIDATETAWSATPLGWAAREGQTAMVAWLLEKGADPHQPTTASWTTPLAWATRRGHQEIIALLKQHNAHE